MFAFCESFFLIANQLESFEQTATHFRKSIFITGS